MSSSAEQIQILYEIAMSIGTSLELDQMLKKALSTLLKKLNCSAGGIHFVKKDVNQDLGFEQIYAIPLNTDRNRTYQAALQHLPQLTDRKQVADFYRKLPLRGQDQAGNHFHLLELPDVGLLVLIKNGQDLDPFMVKSLQPLLEKLAGACQACWQSEELVAAHQHAMKVNFELVEKSNALNRSRQDLLNVLQELRQVAARNQTILDAIPDAMFYLNRSGDILDYKIVGEQDLPPGVSPEMLAGRNLQQILPPDLADLTLHYIGQTLDSRKIQVFECQLPLRQRRQELEVRLVVGEPNEVLAIVRNITKRKQAEKALQKVKEELERRVEARTAELSKSNTLLKQEIGERQKVEEQLRQAEQRYRTLFDEAPVMYVITRDQGGAPIVTDCNQQFLTTLGYRRAEVVGRSLADFYTPASQADLVEGGYQRALQGHFDTEERSLLTRAGRVVETLLRARPETDAEGHVCGKRAMFVDVTARKRAEEALRQTHAELERKVEARTAELSAANVRLKQEIIDRKQTEQTLTTVLNTVGEGIIAVDSTGTIVTVNQEVQRIWGYQQEELIGRKLQILMPEKYRSTHQAGLQRYLQTGAGRMLGQWLELEGLRKDGSTFPLEVHITATRIGERLLFTAAARDITERHEFEKMRDNFVSTVSHELRTPLASIMGFLETVLGGRPGPLTEVQQRFLQNSYKSSERLLKLIEELLTISRIQQGTLKLDKRSFLPAQAVQNVREMVASLAAAKSIGLEVENEWPSDKKLVGDQDRLEQVITNLVGNAIKFTPEGGRVWLHSDEADGSWQFKVVDTGIGIPEADIPRLFQRFYRASNAAEAQIQGTGLGLYVCQAIVEEHGGQIGLESKLDAGTTAWFTIPASN